MNYPFDVELFPSRKAIGKVGAFPTEMSPPEGRFLLVYVASGMKRGVLRMADGQIAFKASGKLYESAMVLVPHGAVFENEFADDATEAYVYDFSCPSLRLNPARLRYYVMAAKSGRAVAFLMAQRLSTYDVAVLRSAADRIFYASCNPADGAIRFRGCLLLQALLAYLVQVPTSNSVWFFDDPRNTLYKEIEAQPRAFKVKNVAKRMGQTPGAVVKGFKTSHGRSPQQFKTEQSLHLAQYYMLQTKMSFKAIALRLGFSSASYFTQFIRRETGKTPRDIRASGKWQKRRERK